MSIDAKTSEVRVVGGSVGARILRSLADDFDADGVSCQIETSDVGGSRVVTVVAVEPVEGARGDVARPTADDLSVEELDSLEYHACSSGTSTPRRVRDFILRVTQELRRRRVSVRSPSDDLITAVDRGAKHAYRGSDFGDDGECAACGRPPGHRFHRA
jgi:hypothetical protein